MNALSRHATAPAAYNQSQIALIQRTVASGTNKNEFDLFVEVCKRVGLDPFKKQIYAVVYNANKPEKRKMSIITGIDGLRAVAERNGNYRADENEPEFTEDKDERTPPNPKGLVKAVVRVWKYGPDGKWYSTAGVARWDEYAPLREIWRENEKTGKREPSGEFELDKSSMWYRMPHVMLAKCAEAQALRKAWPEDLSGLYAREELDQASMADKSASELVEEFQIEQRERAINAKDCVTFDMLDSGPLQHIPVGQVFDRVSEAMQTWTPSEAKIFMDRNIHEMRRYWAASPQDCLELKRRVEAYTESLPEIEAVAVEGDRLEAETSAILNGDRGNAA